MTQRKRPPPKTTPICCRLKTCAYSIYTGTIISDYCKGCEHLKADWRVP